MSELPIPRREYVDVEGQQVLIYEAWWLRMTRHRTDGPALRTWEIGAMQEPVLTLEVWCFEGGHHRMDGPAWSQWKLVNGLPVLTREEWWLQGKRHRVDGPAYRQWTVVDGLPVLTYEAWWFEDEHHRVDGPADRDLRGMDEQVSWALHGKRIPSQLLPSTATLLQRWWRRYHCKRWRLIRRHLGQSGLILWPGLLSLLQSY